MSGCQGNDGQGSKIPELFLDGIELARLDAKYHQISLSDYDMAQRLNEMLPLSQENWKGFNRYKMEVGQFWAKDDVRSVFAASTTIEKTLANSSKYAFYLSQRGLIDSIVMRQEAQNSSYLVGQQVDNFRSSIHRIILSFTYFQIKYLFIY